MPDPRSHGKTLKTLDRKSFRRDILDLERRSLAGHIPPGVVDRIYSQFSWVQLGAVTELMTDRMKEDVAMLEDIVSLTPDTVRRFQERFSEQLPDAEWMELRDELCEIWGGAAKGEPWVEKRLMEWWGWKPYSDRRAWDITPLAGCILPMHIRGRVAYVLAHQAHKLGICENPKCERPYIKQRDDQKICLSPECRKYAGRMRARKYWNKQKA